MEETTIIKTLPNSVPEIKNVYTKFYEMINEFNALDPHAKKDYLNLVTGWLVHEKDAIAYKENLNK